MYCRYSESRLWQNLSNNSHKQWVRNRIELTCLNRMVRFTPSFLILLYLTLGACQSTFPNDVSCVSTFSSNPALFDESRRKITFVFKFDPPLIIRHEKLAWAKPRPFPCRDRQRYYPGLNGTFFDVLNRVAELEDDRADLPIRSALCVYAGDNCTYDGTVRFVDSLLLVDSRASCRWAGV